MEPVSEDQEAFVYTPGERPAFEGTSKFVFDNGYYAARVSSIELGTTRAGNGAYIVKFIGQEGPAQDIEFTRYFVYKDAEGNPHKASFFLDKFIEAAAGVEKAGRTVMKDLVGKYVTLNLVQGEFNGKTRMEIDEVLPPKKADESSVPSPV